jgi:hypothetical protein
VGRIAEVVAVDADGNTRCRLGGPNDLTADHFADSGDDCPPLAGDFVALDDGPGTGTKQATGYHDPSATTARQAAPGEKRIYSRAAPGTLAATVWLKADGTVLVKNHLAAGGGELFIGLDGVVNLGEQSAADFVALSEKVKTELQSLSDRLAVFEQAFGAWVPVPMDGGGALATAYAAASAAVGPAPGSVAAEKAKAT